MSIHTTGWPAIGASATALISVITNIYLARKSRSQVLEQAANQFRQAALSLDVQRTSTVRSAATFIAEKRQKWIDELRSDVATHLAESQEYLWKWDAVREQWVTLHNDATIPLDQRTTEANKLLSVFSEKNGAIDRSHQERHHRLRLRLNPSEPLHMELRNILDEIRKIFRDTQASRSRESAIALIKRLSDLVTKADTLTSTILKTEWDRVKQEAAYPAEMIAKIPPPV
ncbi:hypothetical protein [Cupriavidus pampae]|uniref:Uncharacterized protein n=1 Tax=Cupriavidus pampae TaxID=659251 RepID=A0ABN7ZPX1_9BURK|nr:hypothetical protein [Cupriavidus pampae]CAG9186117.1 hypothetical protein LMG32289_06269 [Cupriavidus pampae]